MIARAKAGLVVGVYDEFMVAVSTLCSPHPNQIEQGAAFETDGLLVNALIYQSLACIALLI